MGLSSDIPSARFSPGGRENMALKVDESLLKTVRWTWKTDLSENAGTDTIEPGVHWRGCPRRAARNFRPRSNMCRRVQRLVSWPDTSLEVLSFQGCRICCVSGKVWFGRQKRVPSHIISSVIDRHAFSWHSPRWSQCRPLHRLRHRVSEQGQRYPWVYWKCTWPGIWAHRYRPVYVTSGYSVRSWTFGISTVYRNEESVGIAIRQSGLSRSEIFVTTKWSGADTDIQRSLETSLAKVGETKRYAAIYHITLMTAFSSGSNMWIYSLFTIHPLPGANSRVYGDHSRGFVTLAWQSVWGTNVFRLLYWHSNRSIGVSNFNIEELECLFKIARVKPVVNQIKFHPYNWAENKLLLEFHKKHGIVTEAYSSLSYVD